MNQTVQFHSLQTSSGCNIESLKQYLLKYCYTDNTAHGLAIQNAAKQLIANCTDSNAIQIVYRMMQTYIMPYYFENRTVFNKVRSEFMRFVSIYLANLDSPINSVVAFLAGYETLCRLSLALDTLDTKEIALQCIQKAKSEITGLI